MIIEYKAWLLEYNGFDGEQRPGRQLKRSA
jgi:hypothetical protein